MKRAGRSLLLMVLCLGSCGRSGEESPSGRPDIVELVKAALPAVVRVRGRGGMAQAEGSGFFVRGEGGQALIATNRHVVWGADTIEIERADGVVDVADLVGVDPAIDLALLRPRSAATPEPLTFGDDARLQAGDWLISLGSPAGVFNAASVGILSARGRVPGATLAGERLVDHIFTDAALSPGSSGGPVLDMRGRVVGVNTAVMGTSRGLGVVMPGGLAARVARDLQREGVSVHAFAGIEVADEPGASSSSGRVRVTAIVPRGPADVAEIQTGDRIVALAGRPVLDARDLRLRIFTAAPGSICPIEIVRAGERISRVLRLQNLSEGERPPLVSSGATETSRR